LGQISTTSYDAIGNTISTADFNGDTIGYSFDENNRLLVKQLPDNTAVSYAYTASGQRESVTDARGTALYAYDTLDRLVLRTDPGGESIAYTYDLAGNRTSVATFSGTTNYTFDALNRIQTVTAPNGGSTIYSYDTRGNLAYTLFPNDTQETRIYDVAGRLLTVESRHVPSNTLINSFDYTLNVLGNRVAVDEHDGRRVAYAYDDLSRLTRETIFEPGASVASRTIDYNFDNVGNRQVRDDSFEGTTSYTYDNNDRLLGETRGGVVSTYFYDDNGNTISKISNRTTVTYDWDGENRLIAADTDGDGIPEIDFRYNADGIRVSKTFNGSETLFLVDANRPYPQVLEELNSFSASDVSYVYGYDLISQQRAGQDSYYHVDGLGSTRGLSDQFGVATDHYTYDAYGQAIGRAGTTENQYQFAGEQRDTDLGLDYLRARFLNPGTGRFVSRDKYQAALTAPLKRHVYGYVENNSVNRNDPSGMFSLAAVIGLSGVQDFRVHMSVTQVKAGAKSILALKRLVPEAIRLRNMGLLAMADEVPGAEDLYELGNHKFLEALTQIPKAFKSQYTAAAQNLVNVNINLHVTGGSKGFFGAGGLKNAFNAQDIFNKAVKYTETATKWADLIEKVTTQVGFHGAAVIFKEIKDEGLLATQDFKEISPFINISIGPVKLAGKPGPKGLHPKVSGSFNKYSVKAPLFIIRH